MDTVKACPKCTAPLPADAPAGLCPKCLFTAGFESNSGAGANPTAGFVPPEPAELARHFPQLEVLELLGMGGMGVVYKARQVALDRVVALKILPPGTGRDPSFAERFTREARALAKLNHPNIVAVYDFGQAGDYYYFLMEFVDGVNVRQMIAGQRLAPREALAIVPQVCDALQYAHDQGIVHRDIKPENLLVDRRGRVRIADFGLARLLGPAAELRLTQTQHVMGTPHYMAPEQLEKPLAVDHRADIYSLGVVIYEMLTGELPIGRFDAPSRKVRVDVRLDEIVLKTLEKEPERRYQHASEIKSEMETLEGVPVSKLPPGLRSLYGTDYRSKRKLFGVPVLHVSMGLDPETGKQREARGIIAIGNKATGVLALGGIARGVFAYGGIAIGIVAMGGVSVGLIGIGGLALGLLLAWGGLSIGTVAFGGLAVGFYAGGGLAFGTHAFGSNARTDKLARDLFLPFTRPGAQIGILMVLIVPTLLQTIGIAWARRRSADSGAGRGTAMPASTSMPRLSRKAVAGLIWACLFPLALGANLFVFYALQADTRQGPSPTVMSQDLAGNTITNEPAPRPEAAPRAIGHRSLPFLNFGFFVLALIGLSAPIGTTVCGISALSDIRRSAGKVYGLPVALADSLIFPLLLLDLVLVALCIGLAGAVATLAGPILAGRGAVFWAELAMLGGSLGLVLAIVANVFLVRYAWRRVSQPITPAG